MKHPYEQQPDHAFWSRAVASTPWLDVDFGVRRDPFVRADSRIATAGSCFASELVRWMPRLGLTPYFAEEAPAYFTDEERAAHHYREFSARYGNVYTVRQLRQLVEQALGDRPIVDDYAVDGSGAFDLLRPHVRPGGFASVAEARLDRRYHLRCVEQLLRDCDVFVFTLGLTEAWCDATTGVVYPACPGTVAGTFDPDRHRPVNFGYVEILDDLEWVVGRVADVNPDLRWIVTVSPVPLVATHTAEHVVVASTYSKSVLRAVCGAIDAARDDVTYFPSFEIISLAQSFGQYLASNLREVTDRGVAHVMAVFDRMLVDRSGPAAAPRTVAAADPLAAAERAIGDECDELLNDPARAS